MKNRHIRHINIKKKNNHFPSTAALIILNIGSDVGVYAR